MSTLAWIRLISFTAAAMVLCIRSVTKTGLITQGCFSYCCTVLTQHSRPFLFLTLSASEEDGGAKKLGGDRASGSQLTRVGISCHIASCPAVRTGERGRKRKMFGINCICLPNSYTWLSPFFPKEGKLTNSRERIPYFALLAQHSFCFTCETALPHPTWGQRGNSCMVLSCLPGLTHSTVLGPRCPNSTS